MAPAYLRFQDRQSPFSSMASFGFTSPCDLTEANPVRLNCTLVDSAFLPTFGPRFNALLLGGFAATGLLLAAIGTYGVIAFLVSQRTREVGVRMALGATPAAVIRLFLRHAARWTAAGLCIGLAGSIVMAAFHPHLKLRTGPRRLFARADRQFEE